MKQMMQIVAVLLLSAAGVAGQIISEIVIRSESGEAISREVVFANMQLRVGDELSREKLSEDIRQLYATGQFANISPDIEESADGRARLLLTFQTKPLVRNIILQGNESIKERRLRKELKLEPNVPLDDSVQSQDLAALYKLYNDKGYTDVQITQRLDRVAGETNEVDVIYIIEERNRSKTRGIDITGNHGLSDRQVKRAMKTDVSFWGRIGFPTGFFSQDEFEQDLDRIRDAYWDRGYLDVVVSAGPVQYSENGKKAYLTVNVEEGQPYIVSEVVIEGNDAYSDEELMSKITTRPGMTFSRERELQDLQALDAWYSRHGYLDARIVADHAPDSETHTTPIIYRMREGIVANIRNIEITGNTITYDNVIRRELLIHPGDLGDMTRIRGSQRRLMNLGYFDKVDVVPVPTDDPSIYDLRINVEEGHTGQLSFGAGISSASDVSLQFELTQTNFAHDNPPYFRGGGQRLSLRGSVGSESQNFSINFTEPWLFDQRLRLNARLWKSMARFSRGWDEESLGGSLRLTKELPWQYWSHSVGYRLENIRISDIDDDYTQSFIDDNKGDHLVSAVMYGVSRTNIDRLPVPNYGSKIDMTVELQGEAIGSYSNIYKVNLGGSQYLPVFDASVVKLQASIDQVDEFSGDEPKVFDRLFAGDLNSIRGFSARSVGPFDPNNEEPVGGNSRLLLSIEMLKPLYQETLYGALFADAGNVWAEPWEVELDQLNVGVGIGIRLFIMRGLGLQVDYGWPVVRKQENLSSSGRLHFNLGYSF